MTTRAMTNARRRSLRAIGAALALVLAFTAGSVFVASGQPEANTYYGCLSGTGGLTKVSVNEEPLCPGAYTLISWNETGPQGLQGEQGEQGETGPQGIQGEQGPAGPELVNVRTGSILGTEQEPWAQDATVTNTGLGTWSIVFPAGTFPPAVGGYTQDNWPSVQLTPYGSTAPVHVTVESWFPDGAFSFTASCGNATDCWINYSVTQNVPEANAFSATSQETEMIRKPTQP